MPNFLVPAAKTTPRVRAFSRQILTQECERRHLNSAGRADLAEGIFRAVAVFLTVRCTRFPRLASALPARFVNDRLPCSTVRNLRRAAVKALEARLSPAPKASRTRPPALRRQPRVVRSHYIMFVPKEGFSRRRTTAQALAAGYPSVSAWTAALIAKPSLAVFYREAATTLALRIVRRDNPRGEHHDALCVEAESAIGEFLGRRLVRFPRIAAQLLTRFYNRSLPRTTQRALTRSVRAAVRARSLRLQRRPPTPAEPVGAVGAAEHVDALLALVRERVPCDERAARSQRAHIALLEGARACMPRRTVL